MRSPDVDGPDAAAARSRLAALRLQPPPGGWTPVAETVAEPAWTDVAPQAAEPVTSGGGSAQFGEILREWAADRLPHPLAEVAQRAGIGAVVTAGLAAAAVLLAAVLLVRHHAAGSPAYDAAVTQPASEAPASPDPVTAAPAAGDPTSLVVDVGGRVRKPGLVTLPSGARVADAVRAAGGPLRHGELRSTNLAARVSDGQLLLIGMPPDAAAPQGAPGDGSSDPSATAAPVSLNSATLEQLETLPGVGPVTGQKIIDWRTAHSGFTSLEQLQDVSGIGPATYAEIAPLVTL